MKEYILKIIKRERSVITTRAIFVDPEELAEEITSNFNKYMEWKDKNIGKPNKKGLYLYWEDHFTLNSLFNYWLTNVKDKQL